MSNVSPKHALCILHLEDSPTDRELVEELFRVDGLACQFRPVETRVNFEAALAQGGFDVILSDYSLPGFDGMTALALAQQRRPQVPFIFISGVMGEERAIESLKNGATDYVLKQRIERLIPSVRRALREVVEREQLRETETRLRQSEEQLRQITENVGDWILVFNADGRCTYANPACLAACEVPPGGPCPDFWSHLDGDHAASVRDEFSLAVRTGNVRRVEFRLRTGATHRSIESQINLVCDDKGARTGVILVCRDITERRHAEEQLRAQAAVLDKATDAIIVCGPEEEIIYWNRSAERLYGWTANEARGRSLHTLLHPAPPPQLAEACHAVQQRGEWLGELRQSAKDGSAVVVQSRWTLFRDDAGRPQSLLVVNTDARNLQLNEAQFLRAQQAASLAALADALARDLRAAVEPVLLASQMLRVRTQADAPRWPDSPDAHPRRVADLMQQVEALARPARAQRMELAVGSILDEVGRQLRQAVPPGIAVTISAPEDLWAVAGDPDALRQAVMNLCVNGREAMPNGGRIEVIAENLALKDGDLRLRGGGRPGMHVVITVADSGCGIPPENLERIFTPFFTTKDHGQTVGVGLTAVQAIARAHGGFVTVDSEVGHGSRFRIHLPATSGTPAPEKAQARRSFPRGNGECILLVDDEVGFREITQVTLEKYGYRVITASDGSEGITLYMRHRQEIQLVLTDIVMPVMDGAALIRSLHKMGAPVRFLAVSGLVEREKVMVATAAPGVHVEFLAKPFVTEKLLSLVREVLQRPAPVAS
ncbi:MAG: response regulator [Verrucomicrobia bacterium]|nr:response regulator [Verrucomicrobiota bacterium]